VRAAIIGRYKPSGVVHVVTMRDASTLDWHTYGLVKLTSWCGGDLAIRFDVELVCQDEAADRVTCRNCTASLEQYELPLSVLV